LAVRLSASRRLKTDALLEVEQVTGVASWLTFVCGRFAGKAEFI
jgi:hypothetical protein